MITLRDYLITKDRKAPKGVEYVLVRYDDNWADEMDLEGVKVMTASDWNELVDSVNTLPWDDHPGAYEYWIGTNESIEINSAEDYLDRFYIYQLSKEEYDVITSILGNSAIGNWIDVPEFE